MEAVSVTLAQGAAASGTQAQQSAQTEGSAGGPFSALMSLFFGSPALAKGKTGKADSGKTPDAVMQLLLASLLAGINMQNPQAAASGDSSTSQQNNDTTTTQAAGVLPSGAGIDLNSLLFQAQAQANKNSNGTDTQSLPQLMMSLITGAAAQTAQTALSVAPAADQANDAAAAQAVTPQAAQALSEIKRLFVDLISQQDSTAEAKTAAQPKPAAVQADTALPVQAAAITPAQADGTPASQADSASAQAAQAAQGIQAHADTGEQSSAQYSSDNASGKDDSGKTPAVKRREPASAAARAYESFTATASGRTSAVTPQSGPTAATAARAFDAVVESIRSMQAEGKKEMEIRLKPDFLGHVVIKLTMDEGGLTASIAASNPKVQDVLAGQASQLQTALSDQGLKDVRVVVTAGGAQGAALQQQTDGQARSQRERPKDRQHAGKVDALEAGPAVPLFGSVAGSGTIDYLA